MKVITLIRGVPGSGKTTTAKKLIDENTDHFEADMFFEKEGEYKFNPRQLGIAHKWCQKKARQALKKGRNVIISNTFIKYWELKPYLEMAVEYGADVKYITCTGHYKNVHGVPEEKVEAMRNDLDEWEEAVNNKRKKESK